jgi:serine O-acetyltransferase
MTVARTPYRLDALVEQMLGSYRSETRAHRINRRYLPSRDEIVGLLDLVLQLFYPGYFGRPDLTDENVGDHIAALLSNVRERLVREATRCLSCASECDQNAVDGVACQERARAIAARFLDVLPDLRGVLVGDVRAAYEGDPAALNIDEVILAYPGILAVSVYRVAHALHAMGLPLMPRIMTEWAHTQTGADIHPGAMIGPRFFLDHATGIVIGETTQIGANVKLYQGVTLGALSVPHEIGARAARNVKRHPTVEDDVTVYANATVLGGDTVLGAGCVIGGGAFITKSVAPGARVVLRGGETTT